MSAPVPQTGKFLPVNDENDFALGPDGPAFLFRSPAMRALRRVAGQVAGSDAPILVYGESGTGKELFSRLIHTLSNRREKPFVPVNCGVLKGELFADKFFGHEAGAYTGANRRQKGSFEAAEDGTLFLDEVGEIPQPNQVDFLRVLEQRTFKRLGGEKDLPFSARIVAATNRSLPEMVQTGFFRADLYYRLNVVPISLPPLRDRREDILPLAEHFLGLFRHRYHKHGLELRPCARRALEAHLWPGNVRELKNLMERVVLLHPDGMEIMAADLPLEMRCDTGGESHGAEPDCLSLEAAVREAETRAIRRAVAAASGSKSRAAELLRISSRTFRHKVALYGMKL
ncbi:sigma-54 dependent transcriptional regulator [hydrocarbon metagenome]|uniref:Sigma-54 dependent transcriptional regulator n=1 Tax=hydrocarbon metagenome TaxID=938273 RepID=A0A0W8G6Y6_9ZZZZ